MTKYYPAIHGPTGREMTGFQSRWAHEDSRERWFKVLDSNVYTPKHLPERYVPFNGGPHLTVLAPDGHFTISVRTSEGKHITFAFCPDKDNTPPQCVDVVYHGDGSVPVNQKVIVFRGGTGSIRANEDDDKPATLTSVCLY